MTLRKRAQMLDRIAQEAIALLGTGRQVPTFSSRFPQFGLTDGYDVATSVRAVRGARGEKVVGRKIGFTNRSVWSGYGISGPIWNYMFDSTVGDLPEKGGMYSLAGLAEPRIEPEIILHLGSVPDVSMSEDELVGCVDWIALGFEIVHSIFPGWVFTAADAVAAYGVHAKLLIGDRQLITENPAIWADQLSSFTITIERGDGLVRSGGGASVLGSPFKALRFLLAEIAANSSSDPLRAGEIITTGTLTEAMPAVAGETWTTDVRGIALKPVQLQFR
ncbi:2-keto-4-pentenoate hydratase [Mesorhizobium sp. P5_C1]